MTNIVRQVATGLVLSGLLVAVAPALAANKPKVSISLNSNKASEQFLGAMISSKSARQKVYLTRQEFGEAARLAVKKLQEPDMDPQKGLFHMEFEKIKLCIAWGESRNECP